MATVVMNTMSSIVAVGKGVVTVSGISMSSVNISVVISTSVEGALVNRSVKPISSEAALEGVMENSVESSGNIMTDVPGIRDSSEAVGRTVGIMLGCCGTGDDRKSGVLIGVTI